MNRIAVLMTCKDRRSKTLQCLESLHRQVTSAELDVYLMDDGSSDGTGEAVAARYPRVNVRRGNGELYWCGGMRALWEEAARHDYDHYLWLNDDTVLDNDAVERVMEVNGDFAGGIVVGTLRDGETHQPTYGGVVRSAWWHPFRYRLVRPQDQPLPCQTMNGNCVLVSRVAARMIGNLDGAFQHALGDFDYGLRARQAGLPVVAAPQTVGTCSRRTTRQQWRDPALGWRQRWAAVSAPKGLPPRQMLVYARRHGGWLWPLFWSIPYLRALVMPTRRSKVDWRFLPAREEGVIS